MKGVRAVPHVSVTNQTSLAQTSSSNNFSHVRCWERSDSHSHRYNKFMVQNIPWVTSSHDTSTESVCPRKNRLRQFVGWELQNAGFYVNSDSICWKMHHWPVPLSLKIKTKRWRPLPAPVSASLQTTRWCTCVECQVVAACRMGK